MAGLRGLIDTARHRLSMLYWAGLEARTGSMDAAGLMVVRSRALALGRITARTARRASAVMAATVSPAGSDHRSTWSHRPELWTVPVCPSGHAPAADRTRLGDAVTLYHDCPAGLVSVRQTGPWVTGFSAVLEAYEFSGSYLSLAVDLPQDAWRGITKGELVGLAIRIVAEAPLTVFARLNVRHGPNTDAILRSIDLTAEDQFVAFDLFYSDIEPVKVSGMWLDVICERPTMNRIEISDLVVSRRPRADV